MPQTDDTWLTQRLSHELLQQNASTAQMLVTHDTQPLTSAAPVAQIEWLQLP
jgi:hypothetical protein